VLRAVRRVRQPDGRRDGAAMKPRKTHYVMLRLVFDKPCDQATAVRGARYGLMTDRMIPANISREEPNTFRVDRVVSTKRD